MRFQRSLSPVGITTSLISGSPRRETCDQPWTSLPFTVTFWRSVDDQTPILAAVLNKLYKVGAPTTNRDDLVAVLGTGIPKVTFTGPKFADELRLNVSIPPTAADKVSRMGVLGGDNAGFPNGRRLTDDVVDIEEQAVAGFLKGKKVPLGDGVDANDLPYLAHFPYAAAPHDGYTNAKATSAT